jgi:methionyl-tRNA synthetase
MSKSLGNVITPQEMVERFGVDGTRYILLSMGGNFGEDFDVTWEKMTEKYNADLANGIGNLTSRIVKLSSISNFKFQISNEIQNPNPEMIKFLETLELGQALAYIWRVISEADKFIEDNKPWELAKSNPEKFGEVMGKLTADLSLISELLDPFMPETSEKIKKSLAEGKVEPLFKRI